MEGLREGEKQAERRRHASPHDVPCPYWPGEGARRRDGGRGGACSGRVGPLQIRGEGGYFPTMVVIVLGAGERRRELLHHCRVNGI
jgi:hypothetical protein